MSFDDTCYAVNMHYFVIECVSIQVELINLSGCDIDDWDVD